MMKSQAYRPRVALDHDAVERTVSHVLERVPPAEFRLVGTASSVLRRIQIHAADIDVLFRDRVSVDMWCTALSPELDVHTTPSWLADSQQYFARLIADGVVIELSTVELESDLDTIECAGSGPWEHFDVIVCGSSTVPAVATELRLITEVGRSREDRYQPIIEYLRAEGCDVPLIERGLAHVGAPRARIDQILTELSRDRPPQPRDIT